MSLETPRYNPRYSPHHERSADSAAEAFLPDDALPISEEEAAGRPKRPELKVIKGGLEHPATQPPKTATERARAKWQQEQAGQEIIPGAKEALFGPKGDKTLSEHFEDAFPNPFRLAPSSRAVSSIRDTIAEYKTAEAAANKLEAQNRMAQAWGEELDLAEAEENRQATGNAQIAEEETRQTAAARERENLKAEIADEEFKKTEFGSKVETAKAYWGELIKQRQTISEIKTGWLFGPKIKFAGHLPGEFDGTENGLLLIKSEDIEEWLRKKGRMVEANKIRSYTDLVVKYGKTLAQLSADVTGGGGREKLRRARQEADRTPRFQA